MTSSKATRPTTGHCPPSSVPASSSVGASTAVHRISGWRGSLADKAGESRHLPRRDRAIGQANIEFTRGSKRSASSLARISCRWRSRRQDAECRPRLAQAAAGAAACGVIHTSRSTTDYPPRRALCTGVRGLATLGNGLPGRSGLRRVRRRRHLPGAKGAERAETLPRDPAGWQSHRPPCRPVPT